MLLEFESCELSDFFVMSVESKVIKKKGSPFVTRNGFEDVI